MTDMDYLTKKEFNELNKDIKAKEVAIETYKTTFANELNNGLGCDILNDLNHKTEKITKQKPGILHKLINLLTTKRTKTP